MSLFFYANLTITLKRQDSFSKTVLRHEGVRCWLYMFQEWNNKEAETSVCATLKKAIRGLKCITQFIAFCSAVHVMCADIQIKFDASGKNMYIQVYHIHNTNRVIKIHGKRDLHKKHKISCKIAAINSFTHLCVTKATGTFLSVTV